MPTRRLHFYRLRSRTAARRLAHGRRAAAGQLPFQRRREDEIKLTNEKKQPVVIHAVEQLYRAANWDITDKSADYIKRDSSTIDFAANLPAKGETTITYTVHYSW